MLRTFRPVLVAVLAALLLATSQSPGRRSPAADRRPRETKAQRNARMKWWREASFGMFIHWGLYSVPAGTYHGKQIGGIGEWIMNNGEDPRGRIRRVRQAIQPREVQRRRSGFPSPRTPA